MDMTRFYYSEGEKPLDDLKLDGGFFGIFRTVACVGDSLASGEFEYKNSSGDRGFSDMYEYSWGQYMARATGARVYNFSRGGMSAHWYLHDYAEENGFWNTSLAAQAYIIALGVNDIINAKNPIGSLADVDIANYRNNKDTFAGEYATIIQRYKEIQPKAKFFLMSMPHDPLFANENELQAEQVEAHAALLYSFAETFNNTYVIDLAHDAPRYDETFRARFFMGDHMNAMGYMFTAQMVMTYIDYIIRKNPCDFFEVPFIGSAKTKY